MTAPEEMRTEQQTSPVGLVSEVVSDPSDVVVGTILENGRQFFHIRAEKFRDMVNMDVSDFTKNLKGLDYLNIARAIYLMKMHFPSLIVQVITSYREGVETPYFDMAEGERGTLLGVYIQDTRTGAVSQTLWYPVMTNTKGSVKPADLECDARSINDNIARATAKLIAQVLGIGFNIFLRLSDEELEAAELGTNRKPIEDVEDEEDAKPVRGRGTGKRRIVEDEEEDEDDEEDDEDDEDDEEEDEEPVRRRTPRTSSRRKPAAEKTTTRRRGLPTRGR